MQRCDSGEGDHMINSCVTSVNTRYGIIICFSNDDPIGKALVAYGEWAQIEIDFLTNLLHDGAVVYDVGANVGFHTLAFARTVGQRGLVCAFEPQSSIYKLLKENVTTNNLRNVIVFNAAVARVSGRVRLQLPMENRFGGINYGSAHMMLSSDENRNAYDVDGISIDSCVLPAPDLIKVDVEGSEFEVLQGARRTIANCRPLIYLEINSLENGFMAFRWLRKRGYQAYFHRCQAYNPANFNQNTVNLFGVAHESNVFFVPSEKASAYEQLVNEHGLIRVDTLDELAQELLRTPRYGDPNDQRSLDERTMEQSDGSCAQNPSVLMVKQEVHNYSGTKLDRLEVCEEQILSAYRAAHTYAVRLRGQLDTASGSNIKLAPSHLAGLARVGRVVPLLRELFEYWTIKRSGLFDPEHYLHMYPDVRTARVNPLWHFVRHGAAEGREPSRMFDVSVYLETNPDVRRSGQNALVHYIRHGRFEGRMPIGNGGYQKLAEKPKTTLEEVLELARYRKEVDIKGNSEIDIIIPVYRGYHETLNCLRSVLAAKVNCSYRLIVIDDCSPDLELSEALKAIAATGAIRLIAHDRNQGFVRSVNEGMIIDTESDVVLLNSDTEVYDYWLDRLRRAAHRRPNIATVTPFSNNATIVSYPNFMQDNNHLMDFADLARVFAEVNDGVDHPLPTGVGFCMYIRRDALNAVGLFDEKAFGRGYGEENDFCCRCAQHGWQNIVAADVFVRHLGQTSFGGERDERVESAMRILDKRYPNYRREVEYFVVNDPLKRFRVRVDLMLLREHTKHDKSVLFFTHNNGGGTEKHIRELERALRNIGVQAYVVRPSGCGGRLGQLSNVDGLAYPNLQIDVDEFKNSMADIIEILGVGLIHVHHFAGFDLRWILAIVDVADRYHIPYYVTIHDYMPICPRINLIDQRGYYCGEPPIGSCETCILENGSPAGRVPVVLWREMYGALLNSARYVFVPSMDTKLRVEKYFPYATVVVSPHLETEAAVAPEQGKEPGKRKSSSNHELVVAVIGAIGPHKGSGLLYECALDAIQRDLPIRFVVVGYTDIDKSLSKLHNVRITGPYKEEKVYEIISEVCPDFAWFPSLWPETYCYALSIAFRARLCPIAFDLGAPAERIRNSGFGYVMPREFMVRPERCNDFFLEVKRNVQDKPWNYDNPVGVVGRMESNELIRAYRCELANVPK